MRVRSPRAATVAFCVVTAVFWLIAGIFLYRGVQRVSEADLQEQQTFLRSALWSFHADFTSHLIELHQAFRPGLPVEEKADAFLFLGESFQNWRENEDWADLLKGISLAWLEGPGPVSHYRYDKERDEFVAAEIPPSILGARPGGFRPPEQPAPSDGPPRRPGPGFVEMFWTNRPVIAFAILRTDSEGSELSPRIPFGGRTRFGGRRSGRFPGLPGRSPALAGWCFLELDTGFLSSRLFPVLMERAFGASGLEAYQVSVVEEGSNEVIFVSRQGVAADSENGDDREAIFGSGLPFPRGFQPERPRRPATGKAWLLTARHRSGSLLQEMVSRRHRNLAAGFAVLALLSGSSVLAFVSAQRVRGLARRQMDFVASVSHELRTPISAIQSAGYNLTRGLVRDEERLKEYGLMIDRESRRLSNMIEKMLSYAGIESGRVQYDFVPVQVKDVVGRVLAEYEERFRQTGLQVEVEAPLEAGPEIPEIQADVQALESILRNLLDNALNYARDGGRLWLSIGCAGPNDSKWVELKVRDQGPGIDPVDLPHVFEPFYRGQGVVASRVSGAGLGLNLVLRHVQAHGGQVRVESERGRGTTFVVRFPPWRESGR